MFHQLLHGCRARIAAHLEIGNPRVFDQREILGIELAVAENVDHVKVTLLPNRRANKAGERWRHPNHNPLRDCRVVEQLAHAEEALQRIPQRGQGADGGDGNRRKRL